jgi:L-ascorbate metabolism protein UlaG (beta-lactamase superfamily)
MTAEEAAKAVNESIKPKKIAIPMHYNSIVGSIKDAETFCNMVHVCKTEILNAE